MGMLLASHTLFYRVHTTVCLTLGVALAAVMTYLVSLVVLTT